MTLLFLPTYGISTVNNKQHRNLTEVMENKDSMYAIKRGRFCGVDVGLLMCNEPPIKWDRLLKNIANSRMLKSSRFGGSSTPIRTASTRESPHSPQQQICTSV
ncbi:hypothetical protein QR680_018919 [Steinernema hermaphroditum]|uniref:Uncharacterized protein n=1 Tax=Steinernema hermaphroditum TaxID=289476 RepID=A0AA39LRT0_9BILA|nr:hypothetical protein QR680_018919 [Steinernema hermaphroditum]